MSAQLGTQSLANPIIRSNHRILFIGGGKEFDLTDIHPHEVSHAKTLDSAYEAVSRFRPDLVFYFVKGRHEKLEEQIMTWLIGGFRGKFILLDLFNRVQDIKTLLQSQVVDEYFSGPISPARLNSILKSQLIHDTRFASPRAMTTFDLFRNLFDRGLNAIFIFSQELDACVAANLRAEQITGHTLHQLRTMGLQELCAPAGFEETLQVIRRAGRHYYDARGKIFLKGPAREAKQSEFSCSVFNFGRRYFVKIEVQITGNASTEASKDAMEAPPPPPKKLPAKRQKALHKKTA
ncbi:MAG: hypothetical protein U1F66_13560 [bacterium]